MALERRLVKLVRHKVGHAADTLVYEQATLPEQREALRKKLIEEAAEYILDPCAEELADVLEVIQALAEVDLGISFSTVEMVAELKARRRGKLRFGQALFVKGPMR